MAASLFSRLLRKTSARRSGSKSRGPRKLAMDSLEGRDMFSVSQLWFSGDMLVVKTDNASTTVHVSQSGSNIRISEIGTSRFWDYASSRVAKVEFQGGAGNDRFINYVANLPVRAFGGAGNDYLEGYNGNDVLVGGPGNDTLVGYGGDDQLWGDDGDDILRGGAGNDQLMGGAGHDRLYGDAGNDKLWGGVGNDWLYGGDGNDDLMGEDGDDWLNGQAGVDRHWGGNGNDVIISIDGALGEYVEGGPGADTLWVDRIGSSRDNIAGSTTGDMIQEVASFANGADRTLNGDRIADPTVKTGQTYRRFDNNPLFGNLGPRMTDVVQGDLGDCYALAGLSAIARDNPQAIRHNVVDFGDGTYGVRLGNSFYRVDNDLPVHTGGTTPAYAQLGANNSMWVAIVEKAFAHYRRGANTYASIEGGWSVEINRAFRSTSAGEKTLSSYGNATAMANDIATRASSGQAVTVGFPGDKKTAAGGAPLVMGHQYTVASVQRNSAGVVTSITLRNPWGTDGGGSTDSNPWDGLVTVTPAQLFAQSTGRVNWGRV